MHEVDIGLALVVRPTLTPAALAKIHGRFRSH